MSLIRFLQTDWATIFRGSGQPIRRQTMPIMRHGKLVYVEGGGPSTTFSNWF